MRIVYKDLRTSLSGAEGFYEVYCEHRKTMDELPAYLETEKLCESVFGSQRYTIGGYAAFKRVASILGAAGPAESSEG